MGYFFAVACTDTDYDRRTKAYEGTVPLFTVLGGPIHIAINRGISPYPSCISHTFLNPKESTFDIYSSWCNADTWAVVSKYADEDNDPNEARVSMTILCHIEMWCN